MIMSSELTLIGCCSEVTRPLGMRTPNDRVSGMLSFAITTEMDINRELGWSVIEFKTDS